MDDETNINIDEYFKGREDFRDMQRQMKTERKLRNQRKHWMVRTYGYRNIPAWLMLYMSLIGIIVTLGKSTWEMIDLMQMCLSGMGIGFFIVIGWLNKMSESFEDLVIHSLEFVANIKKIHDERNNE